VGTSHVQGGYYISSGRVFEGGGPLRLCLLMPALGRCVVGLVSCRNPPVCIAGYTVVVQVSMVELVVLYPQ